MYMETSEGLSSGANLILVVDDNCQIVELICQALKIVGVRSLAAGGPRVAQALWEKHRDEISVVLTDIRMPEMNGDELVNTFLKEKPDLKYVFTSGTPWVTDTPLEQGVNFFQKPFSFREVTTRLKGMIDSDQA